jgi:GT2 family glycosyltransferase
MTRMKTKAPKKKVYIIIVNWNGKNDTGHCLSSLRKIDDVKAEIRIIVVDNGSTDGSLKELQKEYPWAIYIPTGKNLGFTGGNNIGIRFALAHKADYVWLLNNDTIVTPKVLSMLSAFDDPSVGACGSKIYFAPHHEYHSDRYTQGELGRVIWYAGGLIDWHNMYASHRGVDEVDHGQYDKKESTPFITGCSFIVKAEVIEKVGLLDDRYYLYLEDLDWSIRIQRAGWKTLYVPSSILWHVNAGSSGRPGNPLHEYYFTRNRLLLAARYAPVRTKLALIREAVRYLFSTSSLRRTAVIDAFTGRFGKQYEPKNIS